MTIPYDPLVPLADDTIDDGQPEFLNNFSTLFNLFGSNHIALNDSTNPGNHNVIQLVEQAQGSATFSQEVAIYSKKVKDQTDQLFMRYPSNGKEFQLSQYQIYSIAPTSTQEAYFSFLPGGIMVYFGKVMPTGDEFPINLNPAICTNITGVNLCPIGTSTLGTPLYQSNVKLVESGTAYTKVVLNNSTTFSTPPPQYYLIFGNV